MPYTAETQPRCSRDAAEIVSARRGEGAPLAAPLAPHLHPKRASAVHAPRPTLCDLYLGCYLGYISPAVHAQRPKLASQRLHKGAEAAAGGRVLELSVCAEGGEALREGGLLCEEALECRPQKGERETSPQPHGDRAPVGAVDMVAFMPLSDAACGSLREELQVGDGLAWVYPLRDHHVTTT